MKKTNQSIKNKIKTYFEDEDLSYKMFETSLMIFFVVSTFQASFLWTGLLMRIFQ